MWPVPSHVAHGTASLTDCPIPPRRSRDIPPSIPSAGSTYHGTLSADGAFSTPPVTQVFDGISYAISITGQFTETAIDAQVLVEAARQPPCAFTARWAGPKSGDPNVIP
jgi:hypothetical protein